MEPKPRQILLCEDNPDDVVFFERALGAARLANAVHHAADGEAAVDYLSGSGVFADRENFPLPCLVFLDLKMPFLNGFEVLEWLRSSRDFDGICVVMLSSSSETVDVERAYATGANGYLVKPPRSADVQAILNLVAHHDKAWSGMRLSAFGIGR